MTDDDSLAYDLSAWQAPPPPAGLADAVVRRMSQPQRLGRRMWVVAACGVAATAALLIALLIFDRHDLRGSERVVVMEVKPDQPATAPKKPAPAPKPQHTAPGTMNADIATVQDVMKRLKPALVACNDGSFAGYLTLDLHIGKTGTLDTLVYSRKVAFGPCLEKILNAAKFDVRSGTAFVLSFPIVFPKLAKPAPAKQPCDAMALTEKGAEAFVQGNFVAALAGFERSLACKWDQKVVVKAMLAACNAKNVAKAKFYFPKLSSTQQPNLVQRCLDNRIDPR